MTDANIYICKRLMPCDGVTVRRSQHLEEIVARYPADRMAMRVLSLNDIVRDDYQPGVTQARYSLEAFPEDSRFLTMSAFFLE